ncbi:glycoside hydrolase family 3 N-terminal domain-containing protein [Paraflavisolibacter sp. H34]|uniref:glycoside hydrolase family 3 N-terminal domain-containing protein n=1 Tax=Huijunlia imazamoxiresistens TaxID=3127457 RepID=UPI003019F8A2
MKRIILLLLAASGLPFIGFSQLPAYKNKKLAPEARAKDLVARMTLEEKLMQTQCLWDKSIYAPNGSFDRAGAEKVFKNGLGEIARINEGATLGPLTYRPREAALLYNQVQKYFIENTRLGIPVIVHEESLHGQQSQDATNFPVPIGLASSWNEALMTEIYSAVAEEVRARGGQHVLAPVVDVVRDPRWGRTEETMGEDPFLISRLAVAQVRAYQGNSVYLDKRHVATTLKHFGVHGQSEGGLNIAPSHVDERTAREIFFKPFQACIAAGAMNVMATYNELWGQPAHSNQKLLSGILRGEWGFKGVIVSDYGAVSDLHTLHQLTPSLDEAGLLAFRAGVDLETPAVAGFKNLKQYVRDGQLPVKELDAAVSRILVQKFRLGLFDDPYVDPEQSEKVVGNDQKRALAYKAATESLVLLKNDHNFLPLDKSKVNTIAFIGPNADRCVLGGYSALPRVAVSPLQALKEKHGGQMKVLYAEGVRITDTNSWFADKVRLLSQQENEKRIAEAVAVAAQADVVVLFVGGNESTNREGWAPKHLGDLPTLELLAGQNELVRRVAALGKPTCAFVNSGPPLEIGPLVEAVPAVLQCWYLGQEGGYAMVDALFGAVNPGGKLPISFPRTAGHIPAYYNHQPSARRGYHLGFPTGPLFPFGHGLSYTTFRYGPLRLSASSMPKNGSVTLSVEVKNTGAHRGAEVVQLYIRDEFSSVPRPVKELKGFQKIWLEPGQAQTVTFSIAPDLLAFYDRDMKWGVEPGDFLLMVGTSSEKTDSIRLKVTE